MWFFPAVVAGVIAAACVAVCQAIHKGVTAFVSLSATWPGPVCATHLRALSQAHTHTQTHMRMCARTHTHTTHRNTHKHTHRSFSHINDNTDTHTPSWPLSFVSHSHLGPNGILLFGYNTHTNTHAHTLTHTHSHSLFLFRSSCTSVTQPLSHSLATCKDRGCIVGAVGWSSGPQSLLLSGVVVLVEWVVNNVAALFMCVYVFVCARTGQSRRKRDQMELILSD